MRILRAVVLVVGEVESGHVSFTQPVAAPRFTR
jgi:hypothetical protein